MAKVLILAKSGFGKSTSIGEIPEYGIKGLPPEESFVISATSKPLPFRKQGSKYPVGKPTDPNARRYITSEGEQIGKAIDYIVEKRKDIRNIVLDDSNYVMQDYYMANAMKNGFNVFKEIGMFMNKIFTAMEKSHDVNFFMLAHYEEYKESSDDSISYRFKTVGKMVQDYITPEGKFDLVLYGDQLYDEQEGKSKKRFVTNFDGRFPAKSPVGMFEDLLIPNDLGLVVEKINEYYN